MRRLLLLLGVLALAGNPAPAHAPGTIDFYLAVDVPTDLPLPAGSTTVLPWEIARHQLAGPTYTKALGLASPLPPPPAAIDALHLLNGGEWLFSVEAPMDHPTAGPPTLFLPGDVVRYDPTVASPGDYTLEFCGSVWGLADNVNVDAVFLTTQRDDGTLVLSFDIPTTLPPTGATLYHPGDLIELVRTAPGCAGWAFGSVYLDFDAAAAAAGVGMSPAGASAKNVTGADERGRVADGTYRILLTFDVETDLLPPGGSPPGGTTLLPGDVVAWDPVGLAFTLLHREPTWPLPPPSAPITSGYSARINALSMLAAPGTIPCTPPNPLRLFRNTPTASSITLTWSASCSVGAEDYGIHEGVIGTWYGHDNILCTDTGAPLTETIAPASPGAANYYLVVPWNANDEGSYGKCSPGFCLAGDERAVSTPFPNCETNVTNGQELGCP